MRSPLAEAGLTKAEIRSLARALGLEIWDRPSAPCLATRFPYGTPVTREGLGQVAQGEAFLRELGFQAGARAPLWRYCPPGSCAAKCWNVWCSPREQVLDFFQRDWFHVLSMVDLAGYRSGSMNEGLLS